MRHFETARRRYKPSRIRYLLIAESPPELGSSRFFFFEHVTQWDSLFVETMKVLYGMHMMAKKDIRPRKPRFLRMFQRDGFYLIDSTSRPLGEISDSKKRPLIAQGLPRLKRKLSQLANRKTPVVLVSKNVFMICAEPLKRSGFNVLNDEMIDFPSSNGRKYKEKIWIALRKAGWYPASSPVHRKYRCAKGSAVVACESEAHWRALAKCLGRPELALAGDWDAARAAPPRGRLGRLLESLFAEDAAEVWVRRLEAQGVPCEET